MERYRRPPMTRENSVEGIVVIFLDKRGGVAAANLTTSLLGEAALFDGSSLKVLTGSTGAFSNLSAEASGRSLSNAPAAGEFPH